MAMWYDPLQKKAIIYGGHRPRQHQRARHALQRHVGIQRHRLDEAQRRRETPGDALRSAGGGQPRRPASSLLFGGLKAEPIRTIRTRTPSSSSSRNDTWEWDGAASRWTRLDGRHHHPRAGRRENGSIAWDPVGSRLVLFGGYSGGFYHSDVWDVDGRRTGFRRLEAAGRRLLPRARCGLIKTASQVR